MSSFTMYIDILTIVMPLIVGGCIGGAFLIAGYIAADVPCSQVLNTFRKFGHDATKTDTSTTNQVIAFFHRSEDAGSMSIEKEREIAKVNTWCLRLNLNKNYDSIEKQGTMDLMTYSAVGVMCMMMSVALPDYMIVLMVLGGGMIFYGASAKSFVIKGLESRINKLNKSILLEMPIIADEFASVITTGKSIDDIFEEYLPQAGASKRDIEILLADLKNKSRATALTDMSSRIQAGCRADEIGHLIDLLKSSASPITTAENLRDLSKRSYLTYVEPFVKGEGDKKIMTCRLCSVVTVGMMFLMYVAPSFLQIANSGLM